MSENKLTDATIVAISSMLLDRFNKCSDIVSDLLNRGPSNEPDSKLFYEEQLKNAKRNKELAWNQHNNFMDTYKEELNKIFGF